MIIINFWGILANKNYNFDNTKELYKINEGTEKLL